MPSQAAGPGLGRLCALKRGALKPQHIKKLFVVHLGPDWDCGGKMPKAAPATVQTPTPANPAQECSKKIFYNWVMATCFHPWDTFSIDFIIDHILELNHLIFDGATNHGTYLVDLISTAGMLYSICSWSILHN